MKKRVLLSVAKGFVLWLTGLPCSGKTTLAKACQAELEAHGRGSVILDGDELRKTLSRDLGFSRNDRLRHLDRVVSAAGCVVRQRRVAIVAMVSPYQIMRDKARDGLKPFIEVFLRCPLGVCEKRDVKGMYRLARAGKLARFTGVSDVYETPAFPEIIVDTDRDDAGFCTKQILNFLKKDGFLGFPPQSGTRFPHS